MNTEEQREEKKKRRKEEKKKRRKEEKTNVSDIWWPHLGREKKWKNPIQTTRIWDNIGIYIISKVQIESLYIMWDERMERVEVEKKENE